MITWVGPISGVSLNDDTPLIHPYHSSTNPPSPLLRTGTTLWLGSAIRIQRLVRVSRYDDAIKYYFGCALPTRISNGNYGGISVSMWCRFCEVRRGNILRCDRVMARTSCQVEINIIACTYLAVTSGVPLEWATTTAKHWMGLYHTESKHRKWSEVLVKWTKILKIDLTSQKAIIWL